MSADGSVLTYILKCRQHNHVKLRVEHVIDVMVQTTDALMYLHSRHLVHSDFKAEYIYVTSSDPNVSLQVQRDSIQISF